MYGFERKLKNLAKIIQTPISINLKDKVASIEEDNIDLHPHQVRIIKNEASRKTKKEWLDSSRGVKIPLTSDQQIQILSVKDQLFNYLSPSKDPKEVLSKSGGVAFTSHASERLLERIERLSREEFEKKGPLRIVDPETLEKIIESLIHAKNVLNKAEWKGEPYLSYTFLCELEDRELDVVVNFETNILIITIVVKKDTGYRIGEVYSYDEKEKRYIKKLN